MSDYSWYADASLTGSAHVYCAGSLAQCVRRWNRLSEDQKSGAFIRLNNVPNGPVRMERAEIEGLAIAPGLATI